jgi:hypothetical protein
MDKGWFPDKTKLPLSDLWPKEIDSGGFSKTQGGLSVNWTL